MIFFFFIYKPHIQVYSRCMSIPNGHARELEKKSLDNQHASNYKTNGGLRGEEKEDEEEKE